MWRSRSVATAIAFQRLNVALTFVDMSCAKIDPALHQAQKPPWIKVRLPSNPVFFSTKALISDLRLHTVCESAQCPNRWECWSQGTATMMIAGDRCTRACGFCAVTTAKPYALEDDEPQRVAEAVRRMKLKHVVVTAVARDDLKDGGANHFARTITAIREMDPCGHCRSARSRFSCAGLVYQNGAGCRARHLQSQHGNGRAPHAAGTLARQVSDFVASAAARKRAFPQYGDEERCDAWAGRNRVGTFSNDG